MKLGEAETPPQSPSMGSADSPGTPVSLGVSPERAEMNRTKSVARVSKFSLQQSAGAGGDGLPFLIFHPHAGWRIIWDFSMFLLLMYSAIAGPWRMSFKSLTMSCGDAIYWVELSFDVLFCFDILLSCRTAFYTRPTSEFATNSDGPLPLETRSLPILWYYADIRNLWRGNGGGFFVLDVVGSFPVDAVLCSAEGSYDIMRVARAPRVLKALRLVRMLRLLRLARVSRILTKLKDRMKVNPGLLALLTFLSAVMIGTHWLACLWFFAGTLMDDSPGVLELSDPGTATWSTQHKIVSLVGEALNETKYVSVYCVRVLGQKLDPECLEASAGDQYVASIYWAIASLCTIGYGDVKSYSVPEFSISIVTMLAGGFCFAYMVGGLTVMLERLSVRNKNLRDTLYELGGFMHREKVPPNIQSAIRRYFTRRANNKQNIPVMLSRLSGSLKQEVYLLLYKDLVQSVPFFKTFSDKAIVYLISKFQYASASAAEVIYRENQIGDTVYFLRSGEVELSMKAKGHNQPPTKWKIKDKGFFGEHTVLHKRWRLASARAVIWCNMFTLTKQDIDQCAKLYPDAAEALENYRNRVESKWRWAMRRIAQNLRMANTARIGDSIESDSKSRSRSRKDSTSSPNTSKDFGLVGAPYGLHTIWKGLTAALASMARHMRGMGSVTPESSVSFESSRESASREKAMVGGVNVAGGRFGQEGEGKGEQSGSGKKRRAESLKPLPAEALPVYSPHAASWAAGSPTKQNLVKLKALPPAAALAPVTEDLSNAKRGPGLLGLEALPPIHTPPPLPGAAELVGLGQDGSQGGNGLPPTVIPRPVTHGAQEARRTLPPEQGTGSASGGIYANITSGGTRDKSLMKEGLPQGAPTLAPTNAKQVEQTRRGLKIAVKTEQEKHAELLAEWEKRCDVQDILLEEIEHLKQHTVKLKQMTGKYASQVEAQQKQIEELQHEVSTRDPTWGMGTWGVAGATGQAADFMPDEEQ
uniref:Cyclic nucleotide-binding domain-containing protein n=1 Tax=Hemiselmis andersenii TaxID=464988 RepID=A0A6U2GBR6_HEMAN|mmetsp:Transcript_36407/g.85416  ORF Transcript_36407/g.85416 Transcript_36407/m.85416 type:complete len:983 (+) Transcript_36407:128-3076(+)